MESKEQMEYRTGQKAREGESIEKGGLKYDVGKEPVQQGVFEYFPRALLAVARVSAIGAKKYSWGNWKAAMVDGINRIGNAKGRHILKEAIQGQLDPESKELHAAHEAWNCLARLELMLIEKEKSQ